MVNIRRVGDKIIKVQFVLIMYHNWNLVFGKIMDFDNISIKNASHARWIQLLGVSNRACIYTKLLGKNRLLVLKKYCSNET